MRKEVDFYHHPGAPGCSGSIIASGVEGCVGDLKGAIGRQQQYWCPTVDCR